MRMLASLMRMHMQARQVQYAIRAMRMLPHTYACAASLIRMRMQARQVQYAISAMRLLPPHTYANAASLIRTRMQARQVEYAIRVAPGKSPTVYHSNSRSEASSDACRYSVCLLYWCKSSNIDAV